MNKIQEIQTVLGVQPDGVWGKASKGALNQAGEEQKKTIQTILGGLTVDGKWGQLSQGALDALTSPQAAPNTTPGRHISQRGLELVRHFESLFLKAYKDMVGVWTIGWGHTGLTHLDGTVKAGRVITEAQAEELLRHDMRAFEVRVIKFVKVPLTDDQFAALVSFDFNTGGLGRSSVLTKLNAKDYAGAADALLLWNKAGGKPVRGLTRRRKSERNLFLGKTPYIIEA